MRRAGILITGLLLVLICATGAFAWQENDCRTVRHYHSSLDRLDVDLEGTTLVFTYDCCDEAVVEITEDYDLYVDGKLVETADEQRVLVRRCYLRANALIRAAMQIGIEGAQVGVDGAIVGLRALGGVAKMLLTDYTEDDLERDMERHTRRLERKAAKLEKKADRIDKMAVKFELAYDRMEREIPELQEIN